MLIDRAVVEVRSGKGGDGALSFRHEKYVEFGGPDGGNGGQGGDVVLVASSELNTLYAYRHGKTLEAEEGGKGEKRLQHGRNGKDYVSKVPVGTVIYDEAGHFLFDLKEDGERAVVARGGKGGKGNAMYKSSRNRAPRIAENGEPGERKRIVLELKMVADAAIVGLPSAGKSTFLNLISKANAKTGDYPFTTVSPNLGVATLEDGETIVFADVPGLIEGASEGKGLGLSFLRHIERTRVLVHLVSMEEGRDPEKDYLAIRKELSLYGARLEERPEVIVASKMDEEGAKARKTAFESSINRKTIGLSSYTREGVKEILEAVEKALREAPSFPLKGTETAQGGTKVYDGHRKAPYIISRPKSDLFIVGGDELLRKVASINLSTDEGVDQLLRYLNKVGVEQGLIEKGIRPGDTVKVGDFEFTYSE